MTRRKAKTSKHDEWELSRDVLALLALLFLVAVPFLYFLVPELSLFAFPFWLWSVVFFILMIFFLFFVTWRMQQHLRKGLL